MVKFIGMSDLQRAQAPSTTVIVLFSAFLASVAFIGANLIPVSLDLPKKNDLFEIFVGISSIVFAIGFTIFVLRKIYTSVGFGKLFISGWMTTLVMSLLISTFYVIAFTKSWIPLQEGEDLKNVIPVVILKYNALGMMFSALLAIIFKKQ